MMIFPPLNLPLSYLAFVLFVCGIIVTGLLQWGLSMARVIIVGMLARCNGAVVTACMVLTLTCVYSTVLFETQKDARQGEDIDTSLVDAYLQGT